MRGMLARMRRRVPVERAGAACAQTEPAWVSVPGADAPVLVLGMHWAPLMGADSHAQARRRARKARATHYVVSDAQVATMGCVRLPKALRGRNLHAAALVFARLHPHGVAVGVFDLPDGRAWVVAVQAGAVLPEGDCVCADVERARSHGQSLVARHRGPSVQAMGLAELAAARAPATQLSEPASRWRSLPLPMRVLPLLLCAAYAAQSGPRAVMELVRADTAAPAVDAGLAWRQALLGAVAGLPLHTAQDRAALLYGLRRLPASIGGWALRRAACDAGPGGWQCAAVYLRNARGASNAGLAALLAPGFRAEFKTLDEAALSWRVPAVGAPVDPHAWPASPIIETEYATRLQAARAAFLRIDLGAPVPVPVAAPHDERGVPLVRPPGMIEPRSRPLSAQGPLRSLALLAHRPPPGAWRRLTLEVAPDRRPGLEGSQLMARLEGVVYEKR
jgi:hypothetical protein